ncbi:hypothetical protein ABPG74_017456 [Tetrahymena malaccensis]
MNFANYKIIYKFIKSLEALIVDSTIHFYLFNISDVVDDKIEGTKYKSKFNVLSSSYVILKQSNSIQKPESKSQKSIEAKIVKTVIIINLKLALLQQLIMLDKELPAPQQVKKCKYLLDLYLITSILPQLKKIIIAPINKSKIFIIYMLRQLQISYLSKYSKKTRNKKFIALTSWWYIFLSNLFLISQQVSNIKNLKLISI